MNEVEKIEKSTNADKMDIKIVLGVIFIGLLIASLSTKFVTVEYMRLSETIYLYEVKGIFLAVILIFFLAYGLFKKNKKVYIISALLLFASYAYTVFTFFNLNDLIEEFGEFGKNNIQIGEGIYFYTFNYVLLLIDCFIPFKGETKNIKESQKEINAFSEIEGQYILTNYIFGIPKRPDLFEKLAVFIKKKDEAQLQILIEDTETIKLNIQIEDIKTITVKTRTIVSESPRVVDSNSSEQLLAFSIIGVFGPAIVNSKWAEQFSDYNKMSYNRVFDIEMIYNANGIENKMLFQTKIDPSKFFHENMPDKIE